MDETGEGLAVLGVPVLKKDAGVTSWTVHKFWWPRKRRDAVRGAQTRKKWTLEMVEGRETTRVDRRCRYLSGDEMHPNATGCLWGRRDLSSKLDDDGIVEALFWAGTLLAQSLFQVMQAFFVNFTTRSEAASGFIGWARVASACLCGAAAVLIAIVQSSAPESESNVQPRAQVQPGRRPYFCGNPFATIFPQFPSAATWSTVFQ